MNIKIYKTDSIDLQASVAVITSKEALVDISYLSEKETAYVQKRIEKGESFISVNQFDKIIFVVIIDIEKSQPAMLEEARKAGYKVQSVLNEQAYEKVTAFHSTNQDAVLLAFAEGLAMGSYRFLKYFKNSDDKKVMLKEIGLISKTLTIEAIDKQTNVVKALYKVKDMVNEPVSFLNAEQLAVELEQLCSSVGCNVEILNKSKIESLKMGGLLAVNKGSVDPPTFTIIEWKPEKVINAKPYILVGKGVVYDTGGLSLKPTGDSMDYMKSDMSGAAIVGGVLASVASNKLPIHIIALVPATDNRPSGNAYAPGDVITIMDGTNVEMLNADAEGRMILSDALVYAQRYNPELVIDVATLTGSASAAIGSFALVAMGTASAEIKEQLTKSGEQVFERIVEFPLWDDYAELIKSDIADIKNVGGKSAGAITAGKFLQYFTKYPWMHFDIAGVAFSKKNDNYRGKGGSGFSMRLLYNFFEKMC